MDINAHSTKVKSRTLHLLNKQQTTNATYDDILYRFWMHQMWIELYDQIKKPLQIPRKLAEKVNFIIIEECRYVT